MTALTQLLPPIVHKHWDTWHQSDTQALCGKFSWGKASNLQEDCPGLTDKGHGIHSSTTASNC